MTATQAPESSVSEVGPAGSVDETRPARRRWPYLLALFLVLALLGGAGYVLYRTPLVGLQQIEVTARSGDLSPDVENAVKDAVDVRVGTPLITIDLGAVRRSALAIPQVATAAVSRQWPNGLLITVTQHVPAAVTSANGALWLLDTTGFAYLKVPRAQVPAGLLTIELAAPGPHDPATLAALAVVAQLKGPVRSTVGSVRARSPYDVQLNLIDGRTVIWGSPDDSSTKLRILPDVLARPGHTYDISDPSFVTISP